MTPDTPALRFCSVKTRIRFGGGLSKSPSRLLTRSLFSTYNQNYLLLTPIEGKVV